MTVLATSCSATLGNLRYDGHAVSVEADLGLLPAVNAVRCLLPGAVSFDAAVGDDAEITVDGGDGSTVVATGRIATIANDQDRRAVTVTDAGGRLAALRPSASFEGQSVGDIARALADEVGAETGRIDPAGQLVSYVAHQGATAAEHVAHLAALAGLIPSVDQAGRLELRTRPVGPADLALRYGRELLHYSVRESAPQTPTVPIGHGPAGFAGAPDAFLHSAEALSGGAAGPGAGGIWRPMSALRTPEAVSAAATEAKAAVGAGSVVLQARCWLLPAVRPGMLIEIQDLPEDRLAPGPWLAVSVRHTLDPIRGGSSTIGAVRGGAGLGDLLGAALGAIGGLL